VCLYSTTSSSSADSISHILVLYSHYEHTTAPTKIDIRYPTVRATSKPMSRGSPALVSPVGSL